MNSLMLKLDSPTLNRLAIVLSVATVSLLLVIEPVQAQNRDNGNFGPGEFIESSSPLSSGGSVTTRSAPGVGIQTRTSIDSIPVGRPNSRSNPGVNTYDSRYQQASTNTTLTGVRSESSTLPRSLTDNRAPDYNSASYNTTRGDVYPYPAAEARTARLTRAEEAVARPESAAPQDQTMRQTSYQAPGLNYNQVRTAQNCNCAPNQQGFQVPANQPPALNIQPRQAFQVPAVYPGSNAQYQYQVPVQPPALQINPGGGVTAQPPAGVQPQYTAGQFGQFQNNCNCNPGGGGLAGFGSGLSAQYGQVGGRLRNWFNPLVRGTGAYQPIIKLQNMPPGTYLGQGIIGQPTAYVDGQPLRNLLRYIAP